jgi:RsiW-degrading membrane proteinase PrsW (M82 family)
MSMTGWQKWLYHASRSRRFLWKVGIGMLLIGAAVGGVLSQLRPSAAYLFGERALARAGLSVKEESDQTEPPSSPTETAPGLIAGLVTELANPSLGFMEVLWAIPDFTPYIAKADLPLVSEALRSRFNAEEAELLSDFLAANDIHDLAAFDRLKARAEQPQPPRYSRYAVGQVEMRRKNHLAAFEWFRKEGELKEATESRHMAVRALAEDKDFKRLSALRADPRYLGYFSPYVSLQMAIGARDWPGIVKAIPAMQLRSYQKDVIIVTLIAAVAWTLFLVHLGEVTSVLSVTGALCGAAFLAGVLSTTATVFCVVVQDDILGFTKGNDPLRTFAYYLVGVGTREELCKLLLFTPLLPFLIKRDDDREALVVACFVGLGFAIEENGNYFMLSAAASAPGRFLTANFFHIALTGMNGLALFRACTRGVAGVNELMVVLPVTILAHGAYDALIDLPGVEGSSWFSMIVYVLFCYYFFRHVHTVRENVRMTLSLTGAFVIGISMLGGGVIAFQMATLGATAGANLMFTEIMSSAVLLFLFFREFNEPLSA